MFGIKSLEEKIAIVRAKSPGCYIRVFGYGPEAIVCDKHHAYLGTYGSVRKAWTSAYNIVRYD